MAVLFGKSVGGGSSLFTTPDQVTGFRGEASEEGIELRVDKPSEMSDLYLKDYWVTFKPSSQGDVEHPYDGSHLIFMKNLLPGTPINTYEPGTIVKVRENEVLTEFYIACHDYESSLNGTGRTLLVRKDIYSLGQWNNPDRNSYSGSSVDNLLNTTYKALLPTDVQNAMGTTTFPYTIGNGNSTLSTLDRSVFILSNTELGVPYSQANVEGSTLPIATTLQTAKLNGTPQIQWTRSPRATTTNGVVVILESKEPQINGSTLQRGIRPAFTLPSASVFIDDNNELIIA